LRVFRIETWEKRLSRQGKCNYESLLRYNKYDLPILQNILIVRMKRKLKVDSVGFSPYFDNNERENTSSTMKNNINIQMMSENCSK